MVFDCLSCVIEAIHIVESMNPSDSVVDTVQVREGLPIRGVMEFGALASPSLKPVVPAADPILRHVAPAADPSLMQVTPVADQSLCPVTLIAGPSLRHMALNAGPSLRHMATNAGPSLWSVDPTAGPSWKHMAPNASPSLRSAAPTAGPSRRSVDPTAGQSWGPVAPAADPSSSSTLEPHINVRISEQPARIGPKFRYIKESRYPSRIPGAGSTRDRETYPAIEITNYTGKVDIVVSCVTKDKPYRPHPHKLVGRENCSDGLCVMTVDITPENRVVTFSNIGIQCVKRTEIESSLALRKQHKIDPFCNGFDHGTSMRDIDLHAVRLCFQVLPQSLDGYLAVPRTIVSDVIYNGPKMPGLKIVKSSHVSGSARGGTEVILLCEEMKPVDVIVTLHTVDGTVVWRATADCVSFHKNVAVVFTTPPYQDPTTQSPVTAYIQLQSRSTDDRSNSVPFIYTPDPDFDYIERKRKKPLQKSVIDEIDCSYSVWKAVKTEPVENVSSTTPLDPYEPLPTRYETAYPQRDQNVPNTSLTDYNQQSPRPAPVQSLYNTHQEVQSPATSQDQLITYNMPSTSRSSSTNKDFQCPAPSQDQATHNILSSSHTTYTNLEFQSAAPSQDQSTHYMLSSSRLSYTNQEFQCPAPSADQSTHNMPSTPHTSYTNLEFQSPTSSQDQSTHNMLSSSHTSYTNQDFQCPAPSQYQSTHNMLSSSHTSYTNLECQSTAISL